MMVSARKNGISIINMVVPWRYNEHVSQGNGKFMNIHGILWESLGYEWDITGMMWQMKEAFFGILRGTLGS